MTTSKKKGFFGRVGEFFKKAGTIVRDKVYLKMLLFLGKMLLGDRFKGYKTLVAGMLVFLLGLWQKIDGSGLYGQLCELNSYFCGIKESAFYATILMITGGLQQILRVITDTPVTSTENP